MTNERYHAICAEAERYADLRAIRISSDSGYHFNAARWTTLYNRKRNELKQQQDDIDRAIRVKAEADYHAIQEGWPVRKTSYTVRRGVSWTIEYRGFGSGFQRLADGCWSDGGATCREDARSAIATEDGFVKKPETEPKGGEK